MRSLWNAQNQILRISIFSSSANIFYLFAGINILEVHIYACAWKDHPGWAVVVRSIGDLMSRLVHIYCPSWTADRNCCGPERPYNMTCRLFWTPVTIDRLSNCAHWIIFRYLSWYPKSVAQTLQSRTRSLSSQKGLSYYTDRRLFESMVGSEFVNHETETRRYLALDKGIAKRLSSLLLFLLEICFDMALQTINIGRVEEVGGAADSVARQFEGIWRLLILFLRYSYLILSFEEFSFLRFFILTLINFNFLNYFMKGPTFYLIKFKFTFINYYHL